MDQHDKSLTIDEMNAKRRLLAEEEAAADSKASRKHQEKIQQASSIVLELTAKKQKPNNEDAGTKLPAPIRLEANLVEPTPQKEQPRLTSGTTTPKKLFRAQLLAFLNVENIVKMEPGVLAMYLKLCEKANFFTNGIDKKTSHRQLKKPILVALCQHAEECFDVELNYEGLFAADLLRTFGASYRRIHCLKQCHLLFRPRDKEYPHLRDS